MKNALKILLTYLLTLAIGIIVGVIVAVQFFTVFGTVAGQTLPVFTLDMISKAFFIIAPVVLVFASLFLTLYVVRHHTKRVISAITYVILCAVTWVVLFPAFLVLRDKFEPQLTLETASEVNIVSPGFFRKSNHYIYYTAENDYTDISLNSRGIAVHKEGIAIPMENARPALEVQEVKNVSEILKREAAPFSDVLIGETLPGVHLNLAYQIYDLFMELAVDAWHKGFAGWLFFLAFAFALCGAYAFVGISSWRMVSSVTVVFANIFVGAYNFLYYADAMASFRADSKSWGGFFMLIDEPLLFLVNCIVGIVFILIGVICFAVKKSGGDA